MKKILIIGRGYIGSFLDLFLKNNSDLKITTLDSKRPADIFLRYQDLEKSDLKKYHYILWFAGHSSVLQSISDGPGAFANNCTDLIALASKLSNRQVMIYASSASIYSNNNSNNFSIKPSSENMAKLNPVNIYDSSKMAFDAVAPYINSKLIGLRMGTLCGFSEYFRDELLLNSMVKSAKRDGIVNVANRNCWRAILYLEDLAKFILKIINRNDIKSLPTFFNLGSSSNKIDFFGNVVARKFNVRVKYHPDTPTYSFALNCDRALSYEFSQTNLDMIVESLRNNI